MLVTLVAGCRPNFVKLAPIVRELRRREVPFRWIHTGQHAGAMAPWEELELPPPDFRFTAMAKTHAEALALSAVGVETDLVAYRPDVLVVVGDVDSTLGAALAAVKLGVPVAHVEAGYRSGDWTMPEEINRVVVDAVSTLLFCTDEKTRAICFEASVDHYNPHKGSYLVGNVMIDSLRWALERNAQRPDGYLGHGVPGVPLHGYALLTAHRPANVDSDEGWERVVRAIRECPLPILWPGHHRSEGRRRAFTIDKPLVKADPLGYLDMVRALDGASLVITDSGGLLEEAVYLEKPVVSLRDPWRNERAHLLEGGAPPCWKEDAAPKIVDFIVGSV